MIQLENVTFVNDATDKKEQYELVARTTKLLWFGYKSVVLAI